MAGQRQFSYPSCDCDNKEFPLKTHEEFVSLGRLATQTGQPQKGSKGLCSLTKVMLDLPAQAAVDIAHTLVC
jgi:hypothetical protein